VSSVSAKILGLATHQMVQSKVKEDIELPSIYDLGEMEVVPRIFQELKNYYEIFGFVIDPCLGWPRKGWHYQILCNLPRHYLGLSPLHKPGDIDVLIVPLKDGSYYPELAMAIEVKFIKIPLAKRRKDANSSGFSQAQGLLRDGFPFVGILHILVAEPSERRDWKKMNTFILDDFETQTFKEHQKGVDADPIIYASVNRQLGRLEKAVRGTPIGANAFCLILSPDGRRIAGHSLHRSINAQKNPNVGNALLTELAEIMRTNWPIG